MTEQSRQAVQPLEFSYHAMNFRALPGPDGEPRFVASDVARVLGYRSAWELTRNLDDDEKGTQIVRTLGGVQELTVITESGLYQSIFHSRRPEAKPFRKWVTAEVLPAIRKTGGYVADLSQASRATLLSYLQQATAAGLEAEAEAERQALENKRLRPYAELGERVAADDGTRAVAEAAQALGLGQNRLYRYMRELGILIPEGSRRNLPYQEHIEAGRLVVREVPYQRDGRERWRRQTRVTGQGLGYLQKRLEKAGLIEEAPCAS